MLHRFANPNRFSRLAAAILPWSAAGTVVLFSSGLYFALFASPADYQQGDSVRIMYVHVPAAWIALACYSFIAAASGVSLIWKHPLADVAARSAAPLGAGFTVIVLATGYLGTAIVVEAGLSFLGLGVPPPHPAWGRMLQGAARRWSEEALWLTISPGVALATTVFGFNLFGDALRDVLDPRLRGR